MTTQTINQLTIKGNGHWIPIIHWHELTDAEQADLQDNYDDIETSSFFRYRGNIYDLGDEVMRIDKRNSDLKDFDGIVNKSYFSGILVKLSDCGEAVQVYRYYN